MVFEANLGPKNGLQAQAYEFRVTVLEKTEPGSYSSLMIKACSRYSLKPVCDHPSYCRNDAM
eukprot:COSAG05_NODE_17629_length_322_cov_0.690583_1_plen_61_part_01